ncbi:hypothetical protein BGZ76_011879 [Entomortierella beljakovae]|nr:hypothetical protein BGZ76_011879 [Entomortierella beljakovae]
MKITLVSALSVLYFTGVNAQSWCTREDVLSASCRRPDWSTKWIFKAFDHCSCSIQLMEAQGSSNFERCYPVNNPGSFFLQVKDNFQCDVTLFNNNNCNYAGQVFYGKGNVMETYFTPTAYSVRLSCWGN